MKSVIFLLFCFLCNSSYAVFPHHIVYRVDSRDINEIIRVDGLLPRTDGEINYNLTNHFTGESIAGRRSAFVSTSSELQDVVSYYSSLVPRTYGMFSESQNYIYYIYAIRPSSQFYDMETSLANLRDSIEPDTMEYYRIQSLLSRFGGMHEQVALGGISPDRIMAFARIDGRMLNQYGLEHNSQLFSELFWAPRWIDNTEYNNSHNNETSNIQPYTILSVPPPSREMAQLDGRQEMVPLAYTCEGVQPTDSKLLLDSQRCQNFNIQRYFYEIKPLVSILKNIFNE